MTDNTYNGWTNWETWNVGLWIDNEYAIYKDRMADINHKLATWDAQKVRDFVTCWFEDGTPDMDETDGGYDAVNWDELAEAWNEEAESE